MRSRLSANVACSRSESLVLGLFLIVAGHLHNGFLDSLVPPLNKKERQRTSCDPASGKGGKECRASNPERGQQDLVTPTPSNSIADGVTTDNDRTPWNSPPNPWLPILSIRFSLAKKLQEKRRPLGGFRVSLQVPRACHGSWLAIRRPVILALR